MDISFRCACGRSLSVDRSIVGAVVQCPTCGKSLTVPKSAPQAHIPQLRAVQNAPKLAPPVIAFRCSSCGQSLTVEESGAGMKVPCPRCKTDIVIPSAVQSVPVLEPVPKLTPHATPSNKEIQGNADLKKKRLFQLTIGVVVLLVGVVCFVVISSRTSARTRSMDSRPQGSNQAKETKQGVLELKQENEQLRERLAKIEAAQGQSTSKTQSPNSSDSQPSPSWTPERVLQAYLAAESWQERIPLVLDPETTKPLMAQHYMTWQKKTPDFKVHPVDTTGVGDGNEIVVKADVGNESDVLYYLMRTSDGYRINWTKSIEEHRSQSLAAAKRKWGVENAVFEVEFLRVYQSSPKHTRIEIQVGNRSNAFLSDWKLNCTVYDRTGNFLARGYTIGNNLRPNNTTVSEIIFSDVVASEVASYKFELSKIILENEAGRIASYAEKYFTLKTVR